MKILIFWSFVESVHEKTVCLPSLQTTAFKSEQKFLLSSNERKKIPGFTVISKITCFARNHLAPLCSQHFNKQF